MALYYAAVSDLDALMTEREKYEITAETGEESNAAILSDALERAERVVDSKVGVKYAIPCLGSDGSVPQEIYHATIVLARYFLYSRRVPPEHVRNSYLETMAWLDDVATGTAIVNLVVDGVAENNLGSKVRSGVAVRTGVAFNSLTV